VSWVTWALLWAVLLLGGAAVIGLLAWRAFRAGLDLFDAAAAAADRLTPPPAGWAAGSAGFPNAGVRSRGGA
jgi:hypothetical protein